MIYWLVFMSVAIILFLLNMVPNTVGMSFGLKIASICFVPALSTGAFWLLGVLFGL